MSISYIQAVTFISIVWVLIRVIIGVRNKNISPKRELELILVYICVIVVARFTFFPFSKVNGNIQPLVFDPGNMFPPRINLMPFVHITEHDSTRNMLINIIGNTAMFIPVGIIWPLVFKKLDNYKKVLLSGAGFSLMIEILQLPFFDRVTDIDDLILNTLGFAVGYMIYLFANKLKSRKKIL